ncbi:CobW family GTP-binding protein [Acinetobacter chinensis]|uniref:CobW family GTP-binding protein n=1 Tax=Acinetobacter chinensis TaxID=2004650 RepID=A0ABU3WBC9_9GAMM|nr:CobW family GTP-binding protein [Acinetobacter chinensis]MDV2467617.1 CobW family GTP-binding protein [Acinetobacter chinensis]
MKINLSTRQVPVHIISGFLGAGKTTLLQSLLAQKPAHEVWAVLMNEFGQIGVDQQLLPQQSGYEVKELLGGCLCCVGQLPMQIALSRLIQEKQPDRLFIEPTGLGHPAQLLEQLTEPHWSSQINMRALICVVDGSKLHDAEWTAQDLYQDQLKTSEIVVVSHADSMTDADQLQLTQLKQEYMTGVQSWIMSEQGNISIDQIDLPHSAVERKIVPLIHVQKQLAPDEPLPVIKQLPYHYVEHSNGYTVAGWKFSKSWSFRFYDLLDTLCEQQDWLRIKGIFNTDQGWMTFNFNPEQINYKLGEEGLDNRVEMIVQDQQAQVHDWEALETALLACRISSV